MPCSRPPCHCGPEVNLVNLERVGFNLRNFDMVFIWKDLNRDVGRIDTIPSTSLDTIKVRAAAGPHGVPRKQAPLQRNASPAVCITRESAYLLPAYLLHASCAS